MEHGDRIKPRHLKSHHEPADVKDAVASMKQDLPTHFSVENGAHYDIYACPDSPPKDYPHAYPVLDVTKNWPPDDFEMRPDAIYNTICVFDYTDPMQLRRAFAYEAAEVPFIIRHQPDVDDTVMRWADTDYLSEILSSAGEFKTEYSENNHFMYWRNTKDKSFTPPTEMIKMTFDQWLNKAETFKRATPADPHWYFRVSACSKGSSGCPPPNFSRMFDELPFFQPKDSLFMVDPSKQRGIHCRFGMSGVIAENHFDGSRNMIALLGGERRYVLGHPNQCNTMALLPKDHPSGRHSAVDWSNPDLSEFPNFKDTNVNEVVLQPGDVLYLPTQWFHYIISLGTNFQCNTRSGKSGHYEKFIKKCGF